MMSQEKSKRVNQLRSQISIINARLNALYRSEDSISNTLKVDYDERDLHKLDVELQSLTIVEEEQ
jgi:hypothetical protein|tara:strand:- start:2824 stop:3018 length:195 start_codon:yes stop_codon:yes gene_type:complete